MEAVAAAVAAAGCRPRKWQVWPTVRFVMAGVSITKCDVRLSRVGCMDVAAAADAADAGAGRCPHVADADVGCRPRKFGSAFDVRLSRVGCMDVTAAAAAAVAGAGRCPHVADADVGCRPRKFGKSTADADGDADADDKADDHATFFFALPDSRRRPYTPPGPTRAR